VVITAYPETVRNVFRYSIASPKTEGTEQRIFIDITLAFETALDVRISDYGFYVAFYLSTIRAVVIDNRIGYHRGVAGNAGQAI
jgi:hypothetical protein